ncbi:hypothetical protein AN958_04303 [Leucoagaricus sp. SymC.cos]|nr:hypothetical protein AN958_04011 [Leucoagaricus sp. SymC.cos]KXN90434.1 hypothetical protein AN958_04303 [Leucoagaricus sp. SymC.cos]
MDDSPWDDDPNYRGVQETEWSKISNEFINVRYREGITAGKESALQEGFDAGFAEIGVPLGREMGQARGKAAALLGILSARAKSLPSSESQSEVARELLNQLNNVRFSDIAPRDEQAEEHAREHAEEIGDKRQMEELEDMLGGLGREGKTERPTRESVRRLIEEVEGLARQIITK